MLSKAAGAAFVKTSTGFGGGGATVEDVKLMRAVVGPGWASGLGWGALLGDAKDMIAAGATRLGASASVAIVTGAKEGKLLMRATLVVIDSLGVGAMPDAADWETRPTPSHVAERAGGLRLPQLQALGLGNITHVEGVSPTSRPSASWGRASIASAGKDTISGHWEMAGVPVMSPFITFPEGFPPSLMEPFTQAIGRGALGNYPASGTVIIEELGAEHMATGCPIVYTSADSVFQIAAHEEIVPLAQLYEWCQLAFELVVPAGVARVIARPFTGSPGSFVRTTGRRDSACRPLSRPYRSAQGGRPDRHWSQEGSLHLRRSRLQPLPEGGGQCEHPPRPLEALDTQSEGLIFANYVDFDQEYGHRRDLGYARALRPSTRACRTSCRAWDPMICSS